MNTVIEMLIANSAIRGGGSFHPVLVLILPIVFAVIGWKLMRGSHNPIRILKSVVTYALIVLTAYTLILILLPVYPSIWKYYLLFFPLYYFVFFYIGISLSSISYPSSDSNAPTHSTEHNSPTPFNLLVFGFLLLIGLINLVFLRGNMSNIQGADTWIHIDAVLKIERTLQFKSPLFLEGLHHYPPLSYALAALVSAGAGVSAAVSMNIMAIAMNLIQMVLVFLFSMRLTNNRIAAFISMFGVMIFAAHYSPKSLALPLLLSFLIIWFDWNKMGGVWRIILMILISTGVLLSHYEVGLILIIIVIFYIVLSILDRKIPRINNFLKSATSDTLPGFSIPNILLPLFACSLIVFFLFIDRESLTIKEEIPIRLNNIIGFVAFLYLPYILKHVEQFNSRNKKLVLAILMLTINGLFYYVRELHVFHHSRFTEVAFFYVVIPIGIHYFVCFNRPRQIFASVILIFLTYFPLASAYHLWYVKGTNSIYRNQIELIDNLIDQGMLDRKVVVSNPRSYLNRYLPTYYDNYIYATNVLEIGAKPYTTVPTSTETFGFAKVIQRNKIALKFFESYDLSILRDAPFAADFLILERGELDTFLAANQEFPKTRIRLNDHFVLVTLN